MASPATNPSQTNWYNYEHIYTHGDANKQNDTASTAWKKNTIVLPKPNENLDAYLAEHCRQISFILTSRLSKIKSVTLNRTLLKVNDFITAHNWLLDESDNIIRSPRLANCTDDHIISTLYIINNLLKIDYLIDTVDALNREFVAQELTQYNTNMLRISELQYSQSQLTQAQEMTNRCVIRLDYFAKGSKYAVTDIQKRLLHKVINDYLESIKTRINDFENIKQDLHLELYNYCANNRGLIPPSTKHMTTKNKSEALTDNNFSECLEIFARKVTPQVAIDTFMKLIMEDYVYPHLSMRKIPINGVFLLSDLTPTPTDIKDLLSGPADKINNIVSLFDPNFHADPSDILEIINSKDDCHLIIEGVVTKDVKCSFNSTKLKLKMSKALLTWIKKHPDDNHIRNRTLFSFPFNSKKCLTEDHWNFSKSFQDMQNFHQIKCQSRSELQALNFKLTIHDNLICEVTKLAGHNNDVKPLTLPLLHISIQTSAADIYKDKELFDTLLYAAILNTYDFSEFTQIELIYQQIPYHNLKKKAVMYAREALEQRQYFKPEFKLYLETTIENVSQLHNSLLVTILNDKTLEAKIFEEVFTVDKSFPFFKKCGFLSIAEAQNELNSYLKEYYRFLSPRFININCNPIETLMWYRHAYKSDWGGLFVATLQNITDKDKAYISLEIEEPDFNNKYANQTEKIHPILACAAKDKSDLLEHLYQASLKGLCHKHIDFKVKYPSSNSTALHFACLNKHHRIVLQLISYGLNPNAQDKNRNTPLHIAIIHECDIDTLAELYRVTSRTVTNQNGKNVDACILEKFGIDTYKYIQSYKEKVEGDFVLL